MSKTRITIPIFIPHLGCPHRCAFCDQRSTSGQHKIPDKASIHKQAQNYLTGAGPNITHKEIAFFGGSFTAIEDNLQNDLLTIASDIVHEYGLDGIRLSTRPDYISPRIVQRLKRYGVTTVELGAQSFNNGVLTASQRGHTAEDIYSAVKTIKDEGLNFVIQLMPGLPGDTEEKFISAARETAMLAPSGVRIYPAIILAGTELETRYRRGEYTPLSLEKAVEICSIMYRIFAEEKIPVIRMGLHPFAPDTEGEIIAGPYHPAFGFLVKSRIRRESMKRVMEEYISQHGKGVREKIILTIPQESKEEYIGHKRENIRFIEETFAISSLHYIFREIPEVAAAR